MCTVVRKLIYLIYERNANPETIEQISKIEEGKEELPRHFKKRERIARNQIVLRTKKKELTEEEKQKEQEEEKEVEDIDEDKLDEEERNQFKAKQTKNQLDNSAVDSGKTVLKSKNPILRPKKWRKKSQTIRLEIIEAYNIPSKQFYYLYIDLNVYFP